MLKAKLFRKGTLLLFAACLSVLGVVTSPGVAEATLCCSVCVPQYNACKAECPEWQTACYWDCEYTYDFCVNYCNPGC